jgi:hypothetical protein
LFIARAICGLTHVTVAALYTSCSLQQYLEWWPAALYEAGRSVLMLMKGSKIPRIELNTVHLYQHYSVFMHNKLQYTWRGGYCECVRPAQLPALTEVRAPSLLEQHPRYVPHRNRTGYNSVWRGCHHAQILCLLTSSLFYITIILCVAHQIKFWVRPFWPVKFEYVPI